MADHIRATYVIKENDGGSFFFAGTAVGDNVQYVLSASYLNFLVTNGVVLAPRYWKANRPASTRIKDQKAFSILQRAFPNRRVIQLDAEDLNHGGGGIHCITQQQPAVP